MTRHLLCQQGVSREALAALGRCVLCGASCAVALHAHSPVAWCWLVPYVWHLTDFLRLIGGTLADARETLA